MFWRRLGVAGIAYRLVRWLCGVSSATHPVLHCLDREEPIPIEQGLTWPVTPGPGQMEGFCFFIIYYPIQLRQGHFWLFKQNMCVGHAFFFFWVRETFLLDMWWWVLRPTQDLPTTGYPNCSSVLLFIPMPTLPPPCQAFCAMPPSHPNS